MKKRKKKEGKKIGVCPISPPICDNQLVNLSTPKKKNWTPYYTTSVTIENYSGYNAGPSITSAVRGQFIMKFSSLHQGKWLSTTTV